MTLNFCSFSSGSSGNCYMIKYGDTVVLVDVGISGKKILNGLDETETDPEQVKAVLITHEHSDHIKSLRVSAKKLPSAKFYANQATWDNIRIEIPEERRVILPTGNSLETGDLKIRSFPISHDAAEPVGYSFFAGGRQLSVVTDTGFISDQIFNEIAQADLLVLEANHEPEVLRLGRYPYHIKRRILGDRGHLSNSCAAECICKLVEENPKERQILLGHLSNENNTPDLAFMTIKNILEESQIYVGRGFNLEIIRRDCLSAVYEV